jgi:ketosteroid isomerase-like protein
MKTACQAEARSRGRRAKAGGTMLKRIALVLTIATSGAFGGAARAQTDNAALANQLRETERAFAKTMADRNHPGFVSYLSDETVFFGPQGAMRGKAAVAAAWKPFFDRPDAPFSWDPDTAEVLDSGTLGLTSGPVKDPQGKRVGTFNSVWRKDASGTWKIVFDKGCPQCECK